ncbi:MAG: AbrB/MazE/SpoVT family DNA-binding domain-containing protein [Deltaproteobacteria bacterium]|nr:AbrB/MazE/SpoVT family DNA-binding domain-containing protein [Deltaproteobacteria bacterium]
MENSRKLTKIGNSYGLILPKEVLRLSGIDPKAGCRVAVEKERIIIEPAKHEKNTDNEVARAMVRFIKKYRADLAKLASS